MNEQKILKHKTSLHLQQGKPHINFFFGNHLNGLKINKKKSCYVRWTCPLRPLAPPSLCLNGHMRKNVSFFFFIFKSICFSTRKTWNGWFCNKKISGCEGKILFNISRNAKCFTITNVSYSFRDFFWPKKTSYATFIISNEYVFSIQMTVLSWKLKRFVVSETPFQKLCTKKHINRKLLAKYLKANISFIHK